MKRILRWVLGVAAVLVAAPALLLWDSIRRAEASIAGEEVRVASETARLRAASKVATLPRPADLTADQCVNYEDSFGRREEKLTATWWLEDFRRPQSMEQLVILLTKAELFGAEGGIPSWRMRQNQESRLVEQWLFHLSGERPGAAPLRKNFAALIVLESKRRDLMDFVRGESLTIRRELLRVLRSKSDPFGVFERPPCWRDFYSWRVLVARSMILAAEDLEFLEANGIPAPGMNKVLAHFHRGDRHFEGLFRTDPGMFQQGEEALGIEWKLAVGATAVALFQAEKGRWPESALELVPEYLPSLPLHPEDARPLDVRDIHVGFWDGSGRARRIWPVRWR
jgi:hypothetical protein